MKRLLFYGGGLFTATSVPKAHLMLGPLIVFGVADLMGVGIRQLMTGASKKDTDKAKSGLVGVGNLMTGVSKKDKGK
jgi:hypothetical protein